MDKHVICEICGSGEAVRFWRLLPKYYAWCHDCFHWEDSLDPSPGNVVNPTSVLKVSKEEYLASKVLDE